MSTTQSNRIHPKQPNPVARMSSRGASSPPVARRWRASRWLASVVIGLIWLGCASAATGPAFEWAAEPPANRGRVYIFRADPRPSLSTVRVRVNGLEVGRFRDREYETLELAAGSHRLRAGMRGFAFVAWGWNEFVFRVRPGETRYIELSVRLDERSGPTVTPPREAQIGGRAEGHASENVFILQSTRGQAAPALAATTRLAPES